MKETVKTIIIVILLGLLSIAASNIKTTTKTTTVLCRANDIEKTITKYCGMGYMFKESIILNSEITNLYMAVNNYGTAYSKSTYLLIFQL